ncbi:hypothetical protein CIL05_16505 [Virgibacillus profundi]|uniref:Acyl-CoA thioester hydrolase/bile acid-CoA amino acid N-acetyltransferase domain-containing protein n=1 Tax=Virgibacillus profundi TaxID=2024555 RepID=A0A2A2IBL7_9BACI|nr:acyl-CoA thioesterase/BAAT N-terminal domain-containing protein [Virgibacillus profundi]PAV28535.1 hypothetical protein CIL05_16505 [Virgibacillus profundi]PXY52708.1 hypothetical protein CIT14_16650 [Virgibacillus profundi]
MDKKLHFHSNHSFRDAPIDIRIRNLSSFNEVTLFAEMRDNFGSLWKSNAKFKANSKGEIDLAIAMPLAGTYSDRDSTGLFWSMLPVLDDAPKIRTPLQPLITKLH